MSPILIDELLLSVVLRIINLLNYLLNIFLIYAKMTALILWTLNPLLLTKRMLNSSLERTCGLMLIICFG